LGQELTKMRKAARLDARDVSSYLGINASIVSRIENGRTAPTENEVDNYMRVCGVNDRKRRNEMLTICHDVLRKGWWEGYSDDVARTLMDCMWLESKALEIRAFAVSTLPGLLQTPGYAKAVMRANAPQATSEDLDRWLEVRMTRQVVLSRHDPIAFASIIDESAIKRLTSARLDAKPQLDYLIEVSRRSNIDIRVLPISEGVHASTGGGFEVHTLVSPYPQVAILPTAAGDLCVEGDDVQRVVQAYDSLLEVSLNVTESRKFIVAERDKL
jgi:hypothetical protein